jgi:hypothetical protein
MESDTPADYIRANFRPEDRLAVVLIQKSSGSVAQRISTAERIASDDVQAWLHYLNSEKKTDVYISMNVLSPDARGRTKADVAEIRHVYLDIDKNGPNVIQGLQGRTDVPLPNHIIESSPGKYQAIWRVEQFDKKDAEALMRSMVREFGADPAATDCSRVMRVPAFENHKYGAPHLIAVENLTNEVYTPSQFPRYRDEDLSWTNPGPATGRWQASISKRSQSEHDWAYALRALARGDEPDEVARAIAAYRPDKANPQYYSQHTVEKAIAALNRSGGLRHATAASVPER